jgi:hypothetical protein
VIRTSNLQERATSTTFAEAGAAIERREHKERRYLSKIKPKLRNKGEEVITQRRGDAEGENRIPFAF